MPLADKIGSESSIRKRQRAGKCKDCGKRLSLYNINKRCFACIEKEKRILDDLNEFDIKKIKTLPTKKPRKPYTRRKKKFTGLEPNAPIITNAEGGKQSATIYRCDLFDASAMLGISAVLHKGAEKYGEDNWRNLSVEENLNHLLMHVYAYLSGDNSDDHLSHAACRAIFALAKQLRPTYKGRNVNGR